MSSKRTLDPTSRFALMGAIARKVLTRRKWELEKKRLENAARAVAHPYLKASDQRRFWIKVKRARSGCWIWQASRAKRGGYGQFMLRGKMLKAHRVAYELLVGMVPAGLFVCHKCDNPPCCNPRHLFLGTVADNSADMKAKGRGFVPEPPRGEAHHSCKLTVEKVRRIRALRGVMSGVSIAQKFGVSKSAVSRIQLEKSWKVGATHAHDSK